MKNVELLVAVPCYNNAPVEFVESLAYLSYRLGELPLGRVEGCFRADTILPANRQFMAKKALNDGFTHMLCIDSDMRFPETLFERLLAHGKEFVGINYRERTPRAAWLAKRKAGKSFTRIETRADSQGLEEVDTIGFGAVLINVDVLRRLTFDNGPWFNYRWTKEGILICGEDGFFCDLAKQSGTRIFIDHDLSRDCAHIGSFSR